VAQLVGERFPGTTVVETPAATMLTMWLAGVAAGTDGEIWLVETIARPPTDALQRMRHGLQSVDAVFGPGHCLVSREALDAAAETWRRRDPIEGGCLEQLWDALVEAGRRPRTMDDVPHLAAPLGVDATIDAPQPSTVSIGRHTFVRESSIIRAFAYTEITIGAFCSISWDVLISNHGNSGTRLVDAAGRPVPTRLTRLSGGHHPETATTFPLLEAVRPDPGVPPIDVERSRYSKPLRIGSDVWIGVGAKVLGGVTIGHGAVVGAGAVVVTDVPPYAVVLGNPATVLRYRFSPAVIEQLLRIAWWEWPDEIIAERASWFTKPIGEFVAEFGDISIPMSRSTGPDAGVPVV
jgi:acetyltransferase-like isoleucine patch superfamily enzyme